MVRITIGVFLAGAADGGEAVVEPPEVRAQPERASTVHRNDLVHAVREQESAIERRDACVGERQQLAVQVARGVGRSHLN